MPTAEQIVTFFDPPVPPGESPWVAGARPATEIVIAEPDPAWPDRYAELEQRIRSALGPRVLQLDHVGSTAVPGLPAKPIIDLQLIVADPGIEAGWLPPLEAAGFILRVREPWWHGHRLMRAEAPAANIHVFGPDSPEPWRERVFRDPSAASTCSSTTPGKRRRSAGSRSAHSRRLACSTAEVAALSRSCGVQHGRNCDWGQQ